MARTDKDIRDITETQCATTSLGGRGKKPCWMPTP